MKKKKVYKKTNKVKFLQKKLKVVLMLKLKKIQKLISKLMKILMIKEKEADQLILGSHLVLLQIMKKCPKTQRIQQNC